MRGKFLWVGNEKLYIRGVTYGTFRPDENGNQYHNVELIERDFSRMAANGINAVRVYNTPPLALLDLAKQHGLRVMVDLSADQYVGFLTDRKGAPNVGDLVRDKVRSFAQHPAILAYSLGNEIPAALVRWHGRRRIERYLEHLYEVVKSEDPSSIVTYVNYPSTEYLQLPFLDFFCFNVYLESNERFAAYLARLQNIAGALPLVMGEVGLDSYRNGTEAQARLLDSQIRAAFEGGCAGVFVYSWTDEWYRGGAEAEDWAFGLTTRDRSPKPALEAVRNAFSHAPFSEHANWTTFVSVIVCTYNGARTIRDCCEGLRSLEYPNFEVIVVDDGSTDKVADVVRDYGFRVISTPNRGLSNARNTGFKAAAGDIIAYVDDDAYPDPQWLSYLVRTFETTDHAAVGGPNIAPDGDGAIADCITHAPGGPVHILVSDREAEHIPGCNMAFRRNALESIGGFDAQFRVAGDDVDLCWRLQQAGFTVGFCPAAMVWHHRRGSVRGYLRQQRGYGKAEALLEAKWPEKYNAAGHVRWSGRVYGNGHGRTIWARGRIYQGVWGSAPFQSIYQPARGTLASLPLMPEWYLLIPILFMLSTLSRFWSPLRFAMPLLVLAGGLPVLQCGLTATETRLGAGYRSWIASIWMRSLIALLHLLQPLVRLHGRLSSGLTPWRRRGRSRVTVPWPRNFAIWSEEWHAASDRLHATESRLRTEGACVRRGGNFDRWDLEIRGSMLGAARLRMAVEEHGLGRQLVRIRVWPRPSAESSLALAFLTLLAAGAASGGAPAAAAVLGLLALILLVSAVEHCAGATAAALDAILVQHPAPVRAGTRAAFGKVRQPAIALAGRLQVKRLAKLDRKSSTERALGG